VGGIVAEHRLSLASNGRERLLERRLVPLSLPDGQATGGKVARNGRGRLGSVAIVGLGYVKLPTALALMGGAAQTTGYDVSDDRLRAIESGDVDFGNLDRARLAVAVLPMMLLVSDVAGLVTAGLLVTAKD
jgi:UDP-N-acetyl-D-glucosamine dehydrogenase